MRIVLRLSPVAKIAAAVAAFGVVLALYGDLKDTAWAEGWGRGLLITGFVVYAIERARMIMKQRRVPRDGE